MKPDTENEKDSRWAHPIVVYGILTLALLGLLVTLAYLAQHNGWLPQRGSLQP